MDNKGFRVKKDEEIFEELFQMGVDKGFIKQNTFNSLLDLSHKAGELASGIYMDLLTNYTGTEHIGDISGRMCIYAGMLSAYLMVRKTNYMKDRDLLTALIKPRGAKELDQNTWEQLGVKEDQPEAKYLNRHFKDVTDQALISMGDMGPVDEYFGDQLLECLVALFNYGVCVEMNRIEGEK